MFSDNENLKSFAHISFEEFRRNILNKAECRDKNLRAGQFIYCYCLKWYETIGLSFWNNAERLDEIDCFYDDKKIDIFLKSIYNELYERYKYII